MTIFCHQRDHRGRAPIWEATLGRYRWMTEAEHAARDAKETEAADAAARKIAAHKQRLEKDPAYAEAHNAACVPHPMNQNRVSYGRAQICRRADGTEYAINWPAQD